MTKKTRTKACIKAKNLICGALLWVFALSLPQPAFAYDDNAIPDDILKEPILIDTETVNTFDKWLYYDRGEYLSVCGYTGTDSRITIPEKINGKPVREISPRNKGTEEEPHYIFFEEYNQNPVTVTVPEGVLSIAPNTFADSLILNVINLPQSLITIGNRAFARCFNFTLANIPENVVEIGMEAFAQTKLTEIALPQGLKIIGEGAFKASHLTEISIPHSVIYIGKEAFFSTFIEEITLPAGLKKVGSNLLSGCVRLRRVYISEGTEAIDSSIFESCSNLEEVYFPSTLKEINAIFSYNPKLKNLYFAADEEQTRLTLGNNIIDRLTGNVNHEEPNSNLTYYYENVQIAYNTPVPVTEESYSKKPLNMDIMTVILIAASTVCLTLSVIFLTGFISEKKQTEAARTEETKREEEAFHPEVLGAWECEKCGTLNSPIGKYCYKCGRKR